MNNYKVGDAVGLKLSGGRKSSVIYSIERIEKTFIDTTRYILAPYGQEKPVYGAYVNQLIPGAEICKYLIRKTEHDLNNYKAILKDIQREDE